MASVPDRSTVLAALDRVRDPRSGKGLSAAGLVSGLALGPGRAGFMLEVPRADVPLYEPVRSEAEAALRGLPGVDKAQVVLTASAGPAREAARPSPGRPAHVRAVIAVASGKGGVGKSTVAVNLACAFAASGRRAGVLDADVQGPSLPRLLNLSGRPEATPEKKIIPLQAWGLKALSMGSLMQGQDALVWRGPMIASAVNTLVHEAKWGTAEEPLDVLVVDLPPGTGDIQLTLAQKTQLAGVVLVATPQALALDDVRRGAAMFRKVDVPIQGLIENMAWWPDAATGERLPLFGAGGGEMLAAELRVPLLGQIPIDMDLRAASDAGRPLVADQPDHPVAAEFRSIAAALDDRLSG